MGRRLAQSRIAAFSIFLLAVSSIPAASGQQIPPAATAASASPSSDTIVSTTVPSTFLTNVAPSSTLTPSNASSTDPVLHPTSNLPPASSVLPSNPNPPSNDNDPNDPDTRAESAVNWYFAFLAILVIILALTIWLVHRRRKKMKVLYTNARRDALARDMDGWIPSRRWVYGNRRGEGDNWTRREEGLNEAGEAPPAYSHDRAASSSSHVDTELPSPSISIPMQILSREDIGIKPPDYQETVVRPLSSPSSSIPSDGETFNLSPTHVEYRNGRRDEHDPETSHGGGLH